MAQPLYTNNAATVLSAGINSSATSLSVSSSAGSLFPNPTGGNYFYVTLITADLSGSEIVKCTARSGDTLTVTRGQEGTTARSFATGDSVQLRVTAQGLADIFGNGGVQSITGSTNVTVSSSIGTPTISLPATITSNISGNAATATNATNSTNATNATNATNLVSGGTIASNVTATTQSANDNSTKVATTAFVATAISNNLPGVFGQAFTSSGTFTIPNGVTAFKVTVIGGGGGGASAGGTQVGGTGGTTSVSSGTQTITTISATGGAGGNYTTVMGGLGGVGSNGTLNITGGYGTNNSSTNGNGGISIMGLGYGSGGSGNGITLGGGAGGAAIRYFTGLTPGNTLTISVGAGGAAAYTPDSTAGLAGVVIFEW